MVRFPPPPPPKSHDTFCPPLCEFPKKLPQKSFIIWSFRPFIREEKGAQNPNFWVWVSSGWGGVLSREGVGAKKFGMSLKTQRNQTFWRDVPGFRQETHPKSYRIKKVCGYFLAPILCEL